MLSVIRDTLAQIKDHQSEHVGRNVGRNTKEEAILTVLRRQPQATARNIAEMAQLSSRQVERILSKLKADGKLLRHGSTKGGWWEVVQER